MMEVGHIILEHSEKAYNTALKNADRETFFQISSMRESLLNWYAFAPNCNILQLSNGYGSITGLLCRSGGQVTVLEESAYRASCIAKRYEACRNLLVIAGGIRQISPEQKFDYVVVEETVNTEEMLEELLEKVCPFLLEKGRLLFVCNNRFGMKYFCGVPDEVHRIPFAGVRGNGPQKMFTRKELIDALERCNWIRGWNIYYPFPDAVLPQAIYTDKYLPKASVRDRVIPYYLPEDRKNLVCLENEICDGLIANDVFHIFANSFLIECSKSDFQAEAVFAAVSTDRGKEHGFATVITAEDRVKKRVLYPEGKKSLELIAQNQEKLCSRGVCCVEQKLGDLEIEMPFIKSPSLIEYLKNLFRYESNKVEEIFEELYQNILYSSEDVEFSCCALKDELLNEQNAGKILKNAYIDMIPYNCFYEKGKLLFYDQEFVKENFPAKYVLFRALRYTYIYIIGANHIIPLRYFKDKYGLTEIWDIFEKEERRFIEDNRNYDQLSSFYDWAGVTGEEVDKNILRLQGKMELAEKEAEKILETHKVFCRKKYDIDLYRRDYRLNAIKAVQIRMLKRFIAICEGNDLSYCAIYGTLLGVVRHKGYVPWDDDLDLAMPRKDYDKLVEIAPKVFEENYFLQTPESDEGCFYGGYSKLRDNRTTGLEVRNDGMECNQGIWIDIFPLDDVLLDEKEKELQLEKIRFYQRLILKKTYGEKRLLWDIPQEEEAHLLQISNMFAREELCEQLHDSMVNYGTKISDKVAVIARYQGKNIYNEYSRKDFEFLIQGQFEGINIQIPVGYESYLKGEYGEDYSLYPEVEHRKPHHRAVFDTEKSYIDYMLENS